MNPKGKKMKESTRIKFGLTPDGGANTYTAHLELKVIIFLAEMTLLVVYGSKHDIYVPFFFE